MSSGILKIRRKVYSLRSPLLVSLAMCAAMVWPAHAQQVGGQTDVPAGSRATTATPNPNFALPQEPNSRPLNDPSIFRDTFGGTTTVQRAGRQPEQLGTTGPATPPVLPRGARPILRDGDLSFPAEPAVVQDGVADRPEPPVLRDGIDGLRFDTRSDEDVAPFQDPPAGYDRRQFTIPALSDQVDPNNPTQTLTGQSIVNPSSQFAQDNPYAPIGMNVGSFVFFPLLEVAGNAFTNVLLEPQADQDVAIDVVPSGRLTSNWSRHLVELSAQGNYRGYGDFNSEDELGYNVQTRGRLDVTSRTNVEVGLRQSFGQETRDAINADGADDRTSVLQNGVTILGNHRFNRLGLRLTSDFSEQQFGSTGIDATFDSNDDRDFQASDHTVRASWEFKPTLSAFAEVTLNTRDYDVANVDDGFIRSSDGQRYRVGVDFGNTGAILRGTISLGYGVQNPESDGLEAVRGILFDSALEWRATEFTSVLLTGNSDIGESTTANAASVITRTVGLGMQHRFRPNLVANAGFVYSHRDFGGADVQEHEFVTSVDVEYFLRRGISAFAAYEHTVLESDFVGSDYISSELRVGMRLSR